MQRNIQISLKSTPLLTLLNLQFIICQSQGESMYSYKQQSFIINENKELLLEQSLENSIEEIEKKVPIIYEQCYLELRQKKNLHPIKLSILQNSIPIIFNKNHDFFEIKSCSRTAQIQAFNLLNEYIYYQIQNKMVEDETFYDIAKIIEIEETTLKDIEKEDDPQMDFGRKGLVKSELYKHHNYKMTKQNKKS